MKQWNVAILGTGAIAAVMADTLNGMEEARLYAVGSLSLIHISEPTRRS